jgi:hypothetical protein
LWLKAIPADTLTLNNINTVWKSSVVLLGGRYFTVEI